MKVRTMAIDPGGTSGIAFRMDDNRLLTTTGSSPEEVFDFLLQAKPDVVVIENFTAQLIGKWGLHTVRIVGGVYALCHEHEITHKVHMPQARKAFQREAKDLLHGRGTCIHEQDAAAHLLRYEHDQSS